MTSGLFTTSSALEMANIVVGDSTYKAPQARQRRTARALVEAQIAVLKECINKRCYWCSKDMPINTENMHVQECYRDADEYWKCEAQFEQRSIATLRAVLEALK